MKTPDDTLPPSLDSYWSERMQQLWMDMYTAAYFLHGSSAAEEIKDAQIEYQSKYLPGHGESIEGGY